MTDPRLDIEEWLLSKHSTLWGRAYDLSDERSLRAASEWFDEQMRDLYTFMVQS